MSNVFDLFPRAQSSASGGMPKESVDVGVFAWGSMLELRRKAREIDTPSGRTFIADVCRMVARELVYSRYTESGEAGFFRAMNSDTALRRAVDLLDLAEELDGRIQREPSGDE